MNYETEKIKMSIDRTNKKHKLQHNKFAIVDDVGVVSGSYNWTVNASKYNAENCMLFDQTNKEFSNQFEYLTIIQYEGEEYIVLMLVEDEEQDDEEGEVLILKIEKDPETDEDIYVSVDDEEVNQKVFEQFIAMVEADEE